MGKVVMITGGAGLVGSYAVEYLARIPGIDKIIIADKNEELGHTVMNNALIGASLHNFYPDIKFVKLDLYDEKQTADLIKEIQPRVILHSGTLLSSFYYIPLIKKKIKEIGIHSHLAGHTLAKDLVLIHKLMKAVRSSGVETGVVNLSFPDDTNPVLAKVSLSPTVGAGTIDLTVQGVKKAVAGRFNIPMNNISITMVAHHALRVNPPGIVPYYLRIRLLDKDISNKFDLNELIAESNRITGIGARNNAPMTAASAVKNVIRFLNDIGELSHAPGVGDMPGGVPVRITSKGAEMILPEDLTLEEARRINEEGMKMDGIERVENDGTVIFTEQAIRLLREILHLNWERMKLSEAGEMARELISAYKKLENDL